MRLHFFPVIVFLVLWVGLFIVPLLTLPVWGWSELDFSGDWYTRKRDAWQGNYGMDEGWSCWREVDVSDFAGYNSQIEFVDLDAKRKVWWEVNERKRFNMLWNFSDGSKSLFVRLLFMNCKESWGFIEDNWVTCWVSMNDTHFQEAWWDVFSGVPFVQDDFLLSPSYVEVFVYRDGGDVVVRVVNQRIDTDFPVNLCNQSFSVGADWFSNVTVTLELYHVGHGSFKGEMVDVVYEGSYSPDIPPTEEVAGYGIWDFINDLTGIATNNLPSWLRGWITQFGGWFDVFLQLATMLWSWFLGLLPLLPFIVLFWGLDAVFASCHSGSIQPLGYFVSTIIGLVRGAIDTIVGISHAIYDFIHFW